jgi:hypothetical protein
MRSLSARKRLNQHGLFKEDQNRDIENRSMGASGHATDPHLSRHRSNRTAAVLLYVLIPLGVGLWQAWSDPIGADRVLLVGGFLALMGAVSYWIAMALEGCSWIRGLLILAAFLPYAFAAYLTFYKGLWGFSELLAGFSWHVVVRAGAWMFVGGRLAQSLMGTHRSRVFAREPGHRKRAWGQNRRGGLPA